MSKTRKRFDRYENKFDHVRLRLKERFNKVNTVFIYAYRGFGNRHQAQLHGRVLEKESIIHESREITEGFWRNLRKVWKRYESDEIPGVGIKGRLCGVEATAYSDNEGYFTLTFENLEEKDLHSGWHPVELQITTMPYRLEYERVSTGEILIAGPESEFGIISDVDDTIIKSYATSPINRVLTLLKYNAQTRTPFEGVSDLYKALIKKDKNPLFFVSGSSYNLYDMLTAFCDYHKVPKAPFFLRDLGLTAAQWIKQDTRPYKMGYIKRIFRMYPELPFILIGDSGQHDPEIYLELLKEFPHQIKAIYIRHVADEKRAEALKEMGRNVSIPFLIMENSRDALEHAQGEGWV